MNLYWIITIGLLSHFVLALFACLTVKDSFSLPVQRKKSYYLLASLLPLFGSIIAFKKVSQSKSSINVYSSGVYIGGESSDCSGSDGGGEYPSRETIIKAKCHVSLQNPAFSPFKRVIEYAEIIIKDQDLLSSNINNSLQTQGYLFDISQLFEVYLEKLLSRYFTDWYVTGQEELTVYEHQFFKRKMFPDLVLKHKETGQIIVFDAKFKTMRFVKQDLDRADFYQIHSYIQYYLPKAVLGGLLYPLSKNNNGDANYASSLFESEDNNTGFIIDGVFVNEEMTEQQINISEQEFLLRLKDVINRKLVS